MVRFLSCIILFSMLATHSLTGQKVTVVKDESRLKVDVLIGGKPFTTFCYSTDIEKPFLFPVYSPDGNVITRGYPLAPRKGERIDHPHHIGLWFNHGNINGLDFWNNSSVIPEKEKDKYGHISVSKIVRTESGEKGIIEVLSEWKDNRGKTIITENALYVFSGNTDLWTIDHISTLTASDGEVTITDSKEGLFAIRVDRAFEMPANEPLSFTDSEGHITDVKVIDNKGVTGMYHSSGGRTGDSVWGTRNRWVILSGVKNGSPVSMAIFDNPENPGFPAYSHARGYGLFSVNNLGRRSYDPSQQELVVKLAKGESIKLIHRFCVKAGSEMTTDEAEEIFKSFTKEYK